MSRPDTMSGSGPFSPVPDDRRQAPCSSGEQFECPVDLSVPAPPIAAAPVACSPSEELLEQLATLWANALLELVHGLWRKRAIKGTCRIDIPPVWDLLGPLH
jgi:hypothetical protein